MHHFREYVRKGKVSIHKIPTQFQLGDMLTKPQPEALFVLQSESLLQWDAEFMTLEQLALPAKHLRACDILDKLEDLCMDQHANAFAETLSQSVQKDIRPGIGTGFVPGNSMGQETRTVIGTKTAKTQDHAGWIVPNVKFKIAPDSALIAVIGGKALQEWIKAKGFNGETTSRQRTSVGHGKGPLKGVNKGFDGHLKK
jgi:hypothetical protein